MARTKVTPRRQRRSNEARIIVPGPQGGPNIPDRVRDRQLTDAIARSNQINIVNRTNKPRLKIKKLLPERKIVAIKIDGREIILF